MKSGCNVFVWCVIVCLSVCLSVCAQLTDQSYRLPVWWMCFWGQFGHHLLKILAMEGAWSGWHDPLKIHLAEMCALTMPCSLYLHFCMLIILGIWWLKLKCCCCCYDDDGDNIAVSNVVIQVNYPLCTIAHTPRLPEHCVEYVRLLMWPKDNPFGGGLSLRFHIFFSTWQYTWCVRCIRCVSAKTRTNFETVWLEIARLDCEDIFPKYSQ